MTTLRNRAYAWLFAALVATGSIASARMAAGPVFLAVGIAALATWAGAAIAFELAGRRALIALPAALAVLLCGVAGALVVWAAGALVLLSRLRGVSARRESGFVPRRLLLRRVMDARFPDLASHRALCEGFSGPEEELRVAIAPVASLPPSVAIPTLARLSLHTDSITRLTARKRLELMQAALREEAESPTPGRGARYAALRIRKAERLLVLADLCASDADERKGLLTTAAALATVAATDFPNNSHYAATAAAAAARVGELPAARRLLARVTDPRRAWSTARIVRLCERMMPEQRVRAIRSAEEGGRA